MTIPEIILTIAAAIFLITTSIGLIILLKIELNEQEINKKFYEENKKEE